MTEQVRDRWEAAFRRLHLALLGDLDAADVLDRSRARVSAAREAFGRAALQPRCRPLIQFTPLPSSRRDDDGPNYFALIFDDRDAVSTHGISARDDDQAVDRAWVKADARAFEVWDGLRFVERFDPTSVRDANRPESASPDGNSGRDGG